MLIFVVRRALLSIPVLLIATFLTFVMVSATFDPTARLSGGTNRQAAERRAELREDLGLNKPLVVQYRDWLWDASHGDFGHSYRDREPVWDSVRPALGFTLQLIIWGILVAAIFAVGIGVYSAVRQYRPSDYALTGLAFIGIALPPFWFALIANQFFAIQLTDWLGLDEPLFYFVGLHSPGQSGINLDYFRHLFLPVMTLTVQVIASWSRFQRASMLEVLSSDYIRTARAKGVPRRRVIFKHALRNALIPVVTVMALDIGLLVGGLVVTEQIYSIPGMGRLFLQSLLTGDAPVVLSWLLVAAVAVILFNLIADIVYSWLDPRIRLT
jgi:peptide/nickel transport system permease protein